MEKHELLEKIEEEKVALLKYVDRKVEAYLSSGAVNLDEYENDYRLSKAMFWAIATDLSWQYKPFGKGDVSTGKNLMHF